MDIGTGLSVGGYTKIMEHLHTAAKSTFRYFSQKAVQEEIEENAKQGREENHLKVSGDGTYVSKKRISLLLICCFYLQCYKCLNFTIL